MACANNRKTEPVILVLASYTLGSYARSDHFSSQGFTRDGGSDGNNDNRRDAYRSFIDAIYSDIPLSICS
ncbi:MAG: hypothetical protein ACLVEU_04845 [Bacteroides cellulosilyticus]